MTADEQRTWEIARRVCTPAELEALRTRERLANAGRPYGYRSIATELGVSVITVRDRIRRAEARIERERPT
ncbi:Trp family transcriptional regulator [Miltoncostaea oceani]|uniref:Trp family transcriptional regulator n=1 Tax=Miltoncostaea oceani TaxID=2843216 RepID=UPI001C3CD331|nr:Trp family transcriptional regulator [Miltoncostaea oceani]